MPRLNLTLDADTLDWLDRYARKAGAPRAAVALQILREGLARREASERRKKLAADYARGRGDARALLAALESGQLEMLDAEDD